MNWKILRRATWLDTRAQFVARAPQSGSLLDIGSSDGATLSHFAELRPDLHFFATDLFGKPENYPPGCQFHRGDIQKDKLPWPDGSMDAITCMHLVEHLTNLDFVFEEIVRLLKPGGKVYFETPHPRTLILSSPSGLGVGTFTMNFYDDPTHTRPVPVGILAQNARKVGLEISAHGTSRNLIFAATWPWYFFQKPSRKKYTAQVNWFPWTAYLEARKPSSLQSRNLF